MIFFSFSFYFFLSFFNSAAKMKILNNSIKWLPLRPWGCLNKKNNWLEGRRQVAEKNAIIFLVPSFACGKLNTHYFPNNAGGKMEPRESVYSIRYVLEYVFFLVNMIFSSTWIAVDLLIFFNLEDTSWIALQTQNL